MNWTFSHRRSRVVYILLLGVIIFCGLFSRSSRADVLPGFLVTYAGDTLWTLAMFIGIGLLLVRIRTVWIFTASVLISYAVEFSQLIQADWIVSIRGTTFGALFLGAGFLPSDFVCYTVGAALGAAGEWVFFRWRASRVQASHPTFPPESGESTGESVRGAG